MPKPEDIILTYTKSLSHEQLVAICDGFMAYVTSAGPKYSAALEECAEKSIGHTLRPKNLQATLDYINKMDELIQGDDYRNARSAQN